MRFCTGRVHGAGMDGWIWLERMVGQGRGREGGGEREREMERETVREREREGVKYVHGRGG